ncbi:MAG: hypothetical protein ACP6IY_20570, partial [Promethearchaeia archaeon]
NCCRFFHPNKFTDKMVDFLIEKSNIFQRLHIYGLGMRLIKKYADELDKEFYFSIDSTKWTRACNNNLKTQYGYRCNKNTRELFFNTYIETIRDCGIEVEY